MQNDKIRTRKNLFDLKYQRHLQKEHSYVNMGIAISFGMAAIFVGMIEAEILKIKGSAAIFFVIFFLLIPWTMFIPLILKERKTKQRVTEWIKKL